MVVECLGLIILMTMMMMMMMTTLLLLARLALQAWNGSLLAVYAAVPPVHRAVDYADWRDVERATGVFYPRVSSVGCVSRLEKEAQGNRAEYHCVVDRSQGHCAIAGWSWSAVRDVGCVRVYRVRWERGSVEKVSGGVIVCLFVSF